MDGCQLFDVVPKSCDKRARSGSAEVHEEVSQTVIQIGSNGEVVTHPAQDCTFN